MITKNVKERITFIVYLKSLLLSILVLASTVSLAENLEEQSYKACENYQINAKQSGTQQYLLPCKILNRSYNEWVCMIQKQFKESWSYTDAAAACFKNQPSLSILYQTVRKLDERLLNSKSSEICKIAISDFSRFKNSGDMSFIGSLCGATLKKPAEWFCMDVLAKGGNSFSFSSGQCFDRYRKGHR